MIFSSIEYVLFLILTTVLYWTIPQRFRVLLLFIASYIFYMAWEPPFGLIYGPVIFLDSFYFYMLSVAMQRWPQAKKGILIFGVTTELCLLAYFKYAGLLLGAAEGIAHAVGIHVPHVTVNIFLPLAISFTNFVLISYLVDVYRGNEKPDPSFLNFATYAAFFPHLIAGPIVRASELLHQFSKKQSFNPEMARKGLDRFLFGLLLKLFVADKLAPFVDQIYSTHALQAFDTNWMSTYAFAIQLFCDFFAYTLMAQGSAMLMGLTLPDNFNAPYLSTSIQDFWRRWHISLSRWLRDYLYIPLGGSRGGQVKTVRNLWITMGLGGLWHGANWTFLLWGLYQGALLSLERVCGALGINKRIHPIIGGLITFHAVCLGWVLFRAQSIPEAWHFARELFQPQHQLGLLHNASIPNAP